MKMYEIDGLCFSYPGGFRLEVDDLCVGAGEQLAIVGRNAAGKTTLLRLLGFLERPRSWRLFRYRERDVRHVRPGGSSLGFLQQQPWIFHGSVAANLAFPLEARHVPRREIRRRVVEMAERLELGAWLDARARTLSGGARKRLALGRALIARPDLLLLDEPMAHLDPHSRRLIQEALVASRATLILTAHDLHLSPQSGARTVLLENGRITPASPANIYRGVGSGERMTTRGGWVIELPRRVAEGPTAVAVDPSCVVLSQEPLRSSMRNTYRGRIRGIRAQGEQVWLDVESGEWITAVVSRTSYEEMGLDLDREIVISFKAGSVRVL